MAKQKKAKKTRIRRKKADGDDAEEYELQSSGSPGAFVFVAVVVALFGLGVRSFVASDEPLKDPAFDNMIDWLKTVSEGRSKSYFDKMNVTRTLSGNHVANTTKAIMQATEPAFIIPMHFLITPEIGAESPLGKSIQEKKADPLYNISYIATYLMEAKDDPEVFHHPYVRTIFELPGGKKWYPSYMPVLMANEELAQLENTFAIEDIKEFNASTEKEFNAFSKVEECKSWTFDDYLLAKIAVANRVLSFAYEGGSQFALIPLLDRMPLRRAKEVNYVYDESRNSVIMGPQKRLKRGNLLSLGIPLRSNSILFSQHGNTSLELIDSIHNKAAIDFELPADYDFDGSGKTDQETPPLKLLVSRNFVSDRQCSQAWSAMRRWAYEGPEENIDVSMKDAFTTTALNMYSLDNELATAKKFSELASQQLAKFGTSYEEDMKLLEDETQFPIGSNARNIRVVLASEKSILTWYSLLHERLEPLFEPPFFDSPEKMPYYEKVSEYIKEVFTPFLDRVMEHQRQKAAEEASGLAGEAEDTGVGGTENEP